MAIRYSGDVEVRMGISMVEGQLSYVGHVRAPHRRMTFQIPVREVVGAREGSAGQLTALAREPEAYDQAATLLIQLGEIAAGELFPIELEKGNKILIRRVFQSACPVALRPQRKR